MNNKPEVGQIVYSLNITNAARHKEQVLTPIKVTKIGRKYFTCGERWEATQYHLDTWVEKTEYSASSRVYENSTEWEEEKEATDLLQYLKNEFGRIPRSSVSLPALRTIKGIVEENKER